MTTSYAEIIDEEEGPIAIFRLNRPDNGNLFTPKMVDELRDFLETSAVKRAPACSFSLELATGSSASSDPKDVGRLRAGNRPFC